MSDHHDVHGLPASCTTAEQELVRLRAFIEELRTRRDHEQDVLIADQNALRAELDKARPVVELPPWLRRILLAMTHEVENTACNNDHEEQGGCDWCTWDALLHNVPHSVRSKIAMDLFVGTALAEPVPAAPGEPEADREVTP